MVPTETSQSRRFGRGELREAVLRTSLELLAESGLAAFSVAEVARRLGVSTAAPYRHFADRDGLLAAVATITGKDLAATIRDAVGQAGSDPADRFCAATGAYTRFAATRGAGFDVVFAAELERLHDEELASAGRDVMDVLRSVTEATGDRPVQDSLRLVEAQVALAHGYATLHRDGFFSRGGHTIDDIADRAAAASRTLLASAPDQGPVCNCDRR